MTGSWCWNWINRSRMVNTKFIHVFVQIKIVAMVHESVEEKKKRLLCRDLPAALFALRSGGKASPREKGTEKGTDRTRPVRTFFRTLFPYRFWILLIVLQWSCHPSDSYKFEGKWQSLNSPGSVVAFTPDKKMIFYKDKVSFWGQATKHGELTYMLTSIQGPWYHFETFDGDEFFTGGRIETVDENRIRIYIHKHHDILDQADEYYRTEDFDSFKPIMEKILEVKE